VAIGAELNEIALGGADVALLGTDLGRSSSVWPTPLAYYWPECMARVRALCGPNCAGGPGGFGSSYWGAGSECGRPGRGGQQRSNPPIREQKAGGIARLWHGCLSLWLLVVNAYLERY
jgi:hypothetical protein